jgi:hypothetical protein
MPARGGIDDREVALDDRGKSPLVALLCVRPQELEVGPVLVTHRQRLSPSNCRRNGIADRKIAKRRRSQVFGGSDTPVRLGSM